MMVTDGGDCTGVGEGFVLVFEDGKEEKHPTVLADKVQPKKNKDMDKTNKDREEQGQVASDKGYFDGQRYVKSSDR